MRIRDLVWGTITVSVTFVALKLMQPPDPVDLLTTAQRNAERAAALEAKLSETQSQLDLMTVSHAEIEQNHAALRSLLHGNDERGRSIVVNKTEHAYDLMPPKLLLSVENLKGGSLLTQFGTHRRLVQVGELIEFRQGTCDCYLVLRKSVPGEAVFDFGCSEET